MTGFGAAEGVVAGMSVSVELRAVNHRFFNPSIKLPAPLARWESEVREALRRRVARGHVTLFVRLARETGGPVIDEQRFEACVTQLRGLQERHQLGGDVDLAAVLAMPGLFAAPDRDEAVMDADAGPDLVRTVEDAAAALTVMREAEGERLAADIGERLGSMERALERIEARAPERLIEQRDRLRAAVRELTDGLAVDEQRLSQEVAILADRIDVAEELSRFRAHITAFRDTLRATGGEPVGKRLGFLLQEMLRETNTTGSKAADADILQDVVSMKEELERIREQVENLE
ncbi:MAG: YicC/YloC family endoribonuclease [Gemmatimonadaceae bacterium]